MGLTCLASMGHSLILSQLLRLLRNGDSKSIGHIWYWIGGVLGDLLTEWDPNHINNFQEVPQYFDSLAHVLVQAKLSETVTESNWRQITNKIIYRSYVNNFPPVKIAQDLGLPLTETWRKLYLPILPTSTQEILYLTIHDKLPTVERLFRINLETDPYCPSCIDLHGAVLSDREHFFCNCEKVKQVWNSVRNLALKLLPPAMSNISPLDLITLNFSKTEADVGIVWLLGRYLEEIWRLVYRKNVNYVSKEKVFGFLTFKYKADQLGSRVKLSEIPEFM